MRRKGQYLAIESVMTFGLGLVVAIGAITAFGNYRNGVMNQATERQTDIVESRVLQAIQTLDDTDAGQITVDLPEDIGSQDYTLVLDSKTLKILLNDGREFDTRLEQFPDHEFQGSTSGDSVKVFKRGNQFTLRAN